MGMLEKALLIFIFFLPFQFALHPAENIDLALVRVLALIIFFLWIIRSLLKRRLVLPRPPILFFFTAFLLWASLSFLWAENTAWALRKIAFLLSFFPLFLVFFAVLQKPSFRKKILQGLAAIASLAAFLALVQFFSQFIFGVSKVFAFWVSDVLPFFLGSALGEAVANYPSLLVNISGVTVMRASLFFPDPHMFAFFLGMSFPLALALALGKDSQKRAMWMACASLIFVADLLTFSRGGYAGLIFGLMAFLIPLAWQSFWWRRYRIATSVLIFIVLASILASPIGTRLFSSFSQEDNSNVERLRLWQEAAENISLRPWLGTGLGNYPLLVKPSAEYREPIYAHNLYLDIALETGLIGLFLFVAFLFLGISAAWKKWRERQDIFSLALFSALILFSAHAFFETPLFSVHVLPVFLLLLAASIV